MMTDLRDTIEQKTRKQGHFLLASKLHATEYIDKNELNEADISRIAKELARLSDETIQTVVSPEHGAIRLGEAVAHSLSTLLNRNVRFAAARKVAAGFIFLQEDVRRVAEKRVLVVEDVLTSGGTTKKVVELVRATHGTVLGVAGLWNRGEVTAEMIGNPPWLHTLICKKIPSYWPGPTCAGCRDGIPLHK